MLIRHIPTWLGENGVNPGFCAINEDADERYCIVSMHGAWEVFYKERGERSRERRFHVEADAVRYLIEILEADGVVKGKS